MEDIFAAWYSWLVSTICALVAVYIAKLALLLLAALKMKVAEMRHWLLRDILLDLVKGAEAAIKEKGAGAQKHALVVEAAKSKGLVVTDLEVKAAVERMKCCE